MKADLSDIRPALLHNPHSGANRKSERAIQRTLASFSGLLQREIHRPQTVAAALQEFAAQDINLVIVNGGDGTVQAVLTSLLHESPFETMPLLALLQAGSTSMTASDAGLKGKPPRALERLMHCLENGSSGELVSRQALRVRNDPNAAPLFGMAFGTGAVHQGIEFYHSKLHDLDLRREVGPDLAMIRFLWALARGDSDLVAPSRLTVRLDDNPAQTFEHAGTLICTLERLLLGIYPFWGKGDAPLHYTALRARPERLLRMLPRLLRGRHHPFATPEHGYMSHNVHRVEMELEGGFILDGEIFEPSPEYPLTVDDGGTVNFLRV